MVADETMQRTKNARDHTRHGDQETEPEHSQGRSDHSWRPSDPCAARLWDALLAHGFSQEELPRILKQVYYSPNPAHGLVEQLVRRGYSLPQARELARQVLAGVAQVC